MSNYQKQSLRAFLDNLRADEVLDFNIAREDYLMSALALELEKNKRFPVIRMTDPESGQVTVANLFADRERLRRNIHNIVEVEQAADDFKELEYVDDACVQEIVLTGDDINVMDLPIFRHFEDDAGRYITSGIVIARDPDTGRCNFSFHRMMLKGPNRIGISLHSCGDTWNYYNAAVAKGKDLEIAVMIGNHPAYYITGASKIPPTQDDYSWAAAYMNERAKVVKAKTVDIPVPAYAEYILEGKILANEHEDEGPFGEYTGYSTSRSSRNIFEITAITHRKNPIYQDLVPGFAWEHLLLSQFTEEIILLNKMQREIPSVKAISFPKNGCHFHAYMSMDAKANGQAKQAMLLLFGLNLYLKLIIVVDEDINVYDEEEVMWAVATHVQADEDVFIVPHVICNRLDPSSKDNMSAKMGIDATSVPGHKELRVTLPEQTTEQAKELLGNS